MCGWLYGGAVGVGPVEGIDPGLWGITGSWFVDTVACTLTGGWLISEPITGTGRMLCPG